MGKGIDYGLGQTNIDHNTGIRFGVISANDLAHWAYDEIEAVYMPSCGHCGAELDEDFEPGPCPACGANIEDGEQFGDDPDCWILTGEERGYMDSYSDIIITKSPYYSRAAFCSPCAPGACHLANPCDDGERVYCLGPDWFEGSAPYRIFRVCDDQEITK